LALVLGSLALAIWATPRMPSASFYLLPTRIWEMGIGSLLALGLVPSAAPRWAREIVAIFGLAAIMLAVALYDTTTSFPGLAALPPVLGAAALIWAGGVDPILIGRILSWRPLVLVGMLSYSLYLWHWPIMAFTRSRLFSVELPPVWQAATILLAFAAAWGSWRLIEQPFRFGRARAISQRRIFALSSMTMGALAAASAAIIITSGAERRFTPDQLAREAALIPPAERDWQCSGTVSQICYFGDAEPGTQPSWVLWGDSHADALLPAVGAVASSQNRAVLVATKGGCLPLPGLERTDMPPSENAACSKLNHATLEMLVADPRIETIFLAARWPIYIEGVGLPTEGMSRFALVPEMRATVEDPSLNGAILAAALDDLATALTDAGKNLVLVGPVPEMPWDALAVLRVEALFGYPSIRRLPQLVDIAPRQALSDAILQASALRDHVFYVPLSTRLCRPDCAVQGGSLSWYSDNNHLTHEGAKQLVGPILAEASANWSTF